MMPVKGQLTVLAPQPEINYACRTMPRSDGIALGTRRNAASGRSSPMTGSARASSKRASSSMRHAPIQARGATLARLDLPRDTPPVESFFGLDS